MIKSATWTKKAVRGFTLVELAVVVVIIGVLAAFGVPRFLESVERSKASEAFGYLAAVRSAQERYQAREGKYSADVTNLDIQAPQPQYFTLLNGTAMCGDGEEDTWALSLKRKAGSSGYGEYVVTFDQSGFVKPTATWTAPAGATGATISTIQTTINPIGGQ